MEECRKLLLPACLAVLFALCLQAAPVGQAEALLKARQFVAGWRGGAPHGSPLLLAPAAVPQDAGGRYHVFNMGGNDGGFVVMSGDDCTPAVLGYADHGTFDPNNLPPELRAWLQGYADQIAWLQAHDGGAQALRAPARGSIDPLLASHWSQGSPYNQSCPYAGSIRCVTGCVATAMAQVMYFHQHPAQTTQPIPSYTPGYGIAGGSFGIATLDWSHMLPEYSGGETSTQRKAVADLMAMCGSAVHTSYGTGSSSASSTLILMALANYFDYDKSVRLVSRNSYSYDAWNDLIYGELQAGRPVIYTGQSAGGGHCFVIDGYSHDDYFHVNWGWSGYCDGFFLLSVLNPGSNSGIGASSSVDGYSFAQDATIGIRPNAGGEHVMALTTRGMTAPGTTFTRVSSAGNFMGVIVDYTLWNLTGQSAAFDLGTGIFDTSGNLLKTIGLDWAQLENSQGWYSLLHIFDFGEGMTDGTYVMKGMSRVRGTAEWLEDEGSDRHNLTFTIQGNKLSIQSPETDLRGTISVSGGAEAGQPVLLDVSVTNKGSYFNDDLFLIVDNVVQGGCNFEVDAGQTRSLQMSFTPTTTGAKQVNVAYLTTEGGYVTIGRTTVDVDNEYTPPADDNIVFADAVVKAICVANWDTNHDGELSVAEAAAVTNLGDVFQGNTDITQFAELRHFTALTALNAEAFSDCTNLTTVVIPKGVVSLGGGNPFIYCPELSTIEVAEGNPVFDSRDGCNAIVSTKSATLVAGCRTTVIPASVKHIGRLAFCGCMWMSEFTLPEGLLSIGERAFEDCYDLEVLFCNMPEPFAISPNVFSTYDTTTLVVPTGTQDAYRQTYAWSMFERIQETAPNYAPVTITARSYRREYGEDNPDFEFTSSGGSFSGTPDISCEADAQTPVGTYRIVIGQGTVDNTQAVFVDGWLTITPATLTVEALSYERRRGTPNPELGVAFHGFKNDEDESVLLQQPLVWTDATTDSPIGTYATQAEKAVAQNYEMEYVDGVLTVLPGVGDVNADNEVNMTDVVDLVQQVLGRRTDIPMADADLDGDGLVTTADADAIIDIILAQDEQAYSRQKDCPATLQDDGTVSDCLTADDILVKPDDDFFVDLVLHTDSMSRYCAYQFDIVMPQGFALADEGHTVAASHYADPQPLLSWSTVGDGKYRVTCYSAANLPMDGQDGDIIVSLHTRSTGLDDGLYDAMLEGIIFTTLDSPVGNGTTVRMADSQFQFIVASPLITIYAVNSQRTYGDENPTFGYNVIGGTLQGEPLLTCEATPDSPAGTYPIEVSLGTVTNRNVEFVNARLTVEKAMLTASVGDYSRYAGEANPAFAIVYSGFRLDDDEQRLDQAPTATTAATPDSPVGTYPIVVSGGSDRNYDFTYTDGQLTILIPEAISAPTFEHPVDIYSLTGRKVKGQATTMRGLPRGIYLIEGKKVVY